MKTARLRPIGSAGDGSSDPAEPVLLLELVLVFFGGGRGELPHAQRRPGRASAGRSSSPEIVRLLGLSFFLKTTCSRLSMTPSVRSSSTPAMVRKLICRAAHRRTHRLSDPGRTAGQHRRERSRIFLGPAEAMTERPNRISSTKRCA